MTNDILTYDEYEDAFVLLEDYEKNNENPEGDSSDTEWGGMAERIFYQENSDILRENGMGESKFLGLTKEERDKIITELNLNLKFVLTFGTSITAFFPLVESFIKGGPDAVEPDNMTVAYLTICAVAIVLGRPKEEYRKIFSELRMRNVYGGLKDLVGCMKKIWVLFAFICGLVGKVVKEFTGMLAYTMLFVPFILTLGKTLSSERITLMEFCDAITEDGTLKLLSVGIGLAGITVKELVVMLFNRLRDLRPDDIAQIGRGIVEKMWSYITDVIEKFKKIDIRKVESELDKLEQDMVFDGDKVYKWNQWNRKKSKETDRVDRPQESLVQT
jgi:hypothetical protein